ncbi:hypothetical protein ASE37_22765 [Rhizobium sp. Root268]|nr:hypothetical protein ASC86_20125 [Rhizobium sp. Root1212]KRD32243.1 hypothetical protein ASE37_22765 [Rhizobium sp. Root268]
MNRPIGIDGDGIGRAIVHGPDGERRGRRVDRFHLDQRVHVAIGDIITAAGQNRHRPGERSAFGEVDFETVALEMAVVGRQEKGRLRPREKAVQKEFHLLEHATVPCWLVLIDRKCALHPHCRLYQTMEQFIAEIRMEFAACPAR